VTDVAEAAQEFADLAKNLTAVGLDELKRELYKAISDAAGPLTSEIRNIAHLRDYMPDRYADVLAQDLRVTTHKRTGVTDPGVVLFANAPTIGRGGRKVRQRDEGRITHPVFGDRKNWKVQTKGMRPGFFTTPAERSAPRVREAILGAVRRAEEKALGR